MDRITVDSCTAEAGPSGSQDYHARDAAVVQDCDLCVLEDQRLFYIHHRTRSSHWEPPWASWRCRLGLPYGWEQARDDSGNVYYIDHLHRETTYTDPRQTRAPEGKRTVVVQRRPEIGFGFVAAGQQPTIIQFVSPDGPSEGLLFANDQILAVSGIDVKCETKDRVVSIVRAAAEELQITVEQLPPRPRSARRNCKVRFTDRVLVSSMPDSPSGLPPPMPDVMRVFLENGQTRSFKYDENTTVQDILNSLSNKLQLKITKHFALALEYSLGARTSRISLLRPETTLQSIVLMPNSAHLRCVFRFAFIPSDPYPLLLDDPRALDYYYLQCINDVVRGRFAFEMRYEACVRLAALHMQQVAIDSNILKEGRVSISRLEKEYGLNTFLPSILLENVKRREIRKHLRYYLKRDNTKLTECLMKQCGKGEGESPSASPVDIRLMVRLKYIHIVSHLPSFGGRGFSVTFKESQIDMIMQIDPRCGLLVRHPGKTAQPTISIGFDLIGGLSVKRETEVASLISIKLVNNPLQGLEFIVDKDDLDDLVMYIMGYHTVHLDTTIPCEVDDRPPTPHLHPNTPPPYSAEHIVTPSGWNYSGEATPSEKPFDLTEDPPPYDLANSFAEISLDNLDKKLSPIVDKPLIQIMTPPPPRRNSDATKKLLKATDSLLIKNSRQLQLKEMISPILRRPSNPSGRKMDILSDSSDTEDSSWSSPLRSPMPTQYENGFDDDDSCDHSSMNSHRRESIETLIQSGMAQQVPNLEALILRYPDETEDLRTPLNEQATIRNSSQEQNGKINGKASNGKIPANLYQQHQLDINDTNTIVAPIADIDDESSSGQL